MNERQYVKGRLQTFRREDVIITPHARIRMTQRQVPEEEVIENIINPERLEAAIREEACSADEEKFDCYFGYNKTRCHRYILIITGGVVVVTVVKINRRWQHIVEKKLKK